MSDLANRGSSARRLNSRELLGYAVIAVSVWLAWEVVKAPLADRAPPAMAIRVAPVSAEVLRRAAEAEFSASRFDNAQALAEESLARAPFNARAMRIRGLTEARQGDSALANEMLTLAGNWSLRDDPAHAWLLEYRLRRGDYASAFAHADTLARRRVDLHPSLFNLFTTSVIHDPRATGSLVTLIARNPPWREAYLESLHGSAQGAAVAGTLALALERTKAPLNIYELQRLYTKWLEARRFAGVRELRNRLGRPTPTVLVQNADFSTALNDQIFPFGWQLGHAAGIEGGLNKDDLSLGNTAYRLDYDGFGVGVFLDQLLILAPGAYVLTWNQRVEAGDVASRFEWQILCSGNATGYSIASPTDETGTDGRWRRLSASFTVPAQNCDVQWLQLVARPGDRRTTIAMWFDDINVQRPGGRSTGSGN